MWLNAQSDSKKKCLILKNLCAMILWDLERIVANDSILWVLWGVCIYRKGWQVKNFGQKQQSESIHLMCESIQTAKWQARWTMKIDTHQTLFESIQISPDEDWYDSNSYESIQSKSESFMTRFTEIWIDSGTEEGKIDVVDIWIDSEFFWIDSLWYYSGKPWIDLIHSDAIHGNLT
jgi:hypothetical protein